MPKDLSWGHHVDFFECFDRVDKERACLKKEKNSRLPNKQLFTKSDALFAKDSQFRS